MADTTRPITRLTIKDTETGTETETDIKTCARGVECDEGKTAQDHISDFVAHKKDVNRHVLVQVGGDGPETGPALWSDDDNLLHYKDKSGNVTDLYPVTKPDNVEGLSALLTAAKQEAQTNLNLHTSNTSNPHSVTYDQVGAAAASHTHSGSDLTSAVPISKGGTGATEAEAALTNLGGMKTDMSNADLGPTWREGEMPAGVWVSVCYGNGKFVAVADDSDVASYSTDGITWTAATLPSSAYWSSVCYGDGKFVAVADDSDVASYSTDGITWTAATLPSSAYWSSVCYGDGKFVAVASGGTKAAYSTDGVTWTAATLSRGLNWSSVCYGSGRFVAVASNYSVASSSTDGINWIDVTMPTKNWSSICYGKGKFVAVTKNNRAAYSMDGINWTKITTIQPYNWVSVCYGDGKFVAVGSSHFVYSTDGIDWTEGNLLSSYKWTSVCYGNGKFVAVSGDLVKTPSAVADATLSAISQLNAAGLARIQALAYVGTGTYGSNNPTSLTFDFAPKVVLVQNTNTAAYRMTALNGSTVALVNNFSGGSDMYVTWDGVTVSWYSSDSVDNQLNASGVIYAVVAIG